MMLQAPARRTGPVSRRSRLLLGVTLIAAAFALPAAAADTVALSVDVSKTVAPKPTAAKVNGAALSLTLEPKSVTVVAVEP